MPLLLLLLLLLLVRMKLACAMSGLLIEGEVTAAAGSTWLSNLLKGSLTLTDSVSSMSDSAAPFDQACSQKGTCSIFALVEEQHCKFCSSENLLLGGGQKHVPTLS